MARRIARFPRGINAGEHAPLISGGFSTIARETSSRTCPHPPHPQRSPESSSASSSSTRRTTTPSPSSGPTAPRGRAKPEPVTIVGALPGVECGETLHLSGEWTRHSQHGAQFKVAAFRSELPASVYGIRKYLGSGLVPGIGRVYANKIVDAFGTDTFRVLSEESARLRDVAGHRAQARRGDQAGLGRQAHRARAVHLPADLRGEPRPVRQARQAVRGAGQGGPHHRALPGGPRDRGHRLQDGRPDRDQPRLRQRRAAEARRGDPLRDGDAPGGGPHRLSARRGCATMPPRCSTPRPTSSPPGSRRSSARGSSSGTSRPPPGRRCRARASSSCPRNDRAERKIAEVVARLSRAASGLPPIKVDAAIEWAEKKAGFGFHELQRAARPKRARPQALDPDGRPGHGKDLHPARAGQHPQGEGGAGAPGRADGPGGAAARRDDRGVRLHDPQAPQVRPRRRDSRRTSPTRSRPTS